MQAHSVLWPEANRAEYIEIDIEEPGPGELLLEAEVTLISIGTERNFFVGRNDLAVWGAAFPFRPGYAFAGRVLRAGSADSDFRPGDRVIAGGHKGTPSGGHASHILSPEHAVIRVPDGVDLQDAIVASLGAVPLGALQRAQPDLGDAIAVMGLGGIGLLGVIAARLSGGAPVIALDTNPVRREVALRVGADLAFDPADPAALEALHALPRGGADIVLECTALAKPLDLALAIAGHRGRVVQVSSVQERSDLDLHDSLHLKGLTLIGGFTGAGVRVDKTPGNWPHDALDGALLELLRLGRFDARPLISHRIPAPEAATAYRLIADGSPDLVGIVLDWTGVNQH